VAKLLVVGSGSEDKSTLALFFEFAGHRCEVAYGVEQAYQFLKTTPFDLIVFDGIGDNSSAAIAPTLNFIVPETPVLVLTADKCTEGDNTETDSINPQGLLTMIEHVLRTDSQLKVVQHGGMGTGSYLRRGPRSNPTGIQAPARRVCRRN